MQTVIFGGVNIKRNDPRLDVLEMLKAFQIHSVSSTIKLVTTRKLKIFGIERFKNFRKFS